MSVNRPLLRRTGFGRCWHRSPAPWYCRPPTPKGPPLVKPNPPPCRCCKRLPAMTPDDLVALALRIIGEEVLAGRASLGPEPVAA